LNYLKYQEKLDLNQVNQIYYTPESAFIELNPGWFSYENNNYVGTFKPKKIYINKQNLNSVGSTQFSLNPASEIKNATISEWSYLPGRHLTSYLNSKH
jgi:hypothetical protein